MFEKLLDLVLRFWELIIPWVVVKQYEAGVILRLGKYHRTINGGLNFKWPFLETSDLATIVIQTMELPTQTVRDKIVSFIIRFHVEDVKKFLLDVHDTDEVIRDISMGTILDATELNEEPNEIEKYTLTRLKRKLKPFGIKVSEATITDYGKVKSLRIIMDEAE